MKILKTALTAEKDDKNYAALYVFYLVFKLKELFFTGLTVSVKIVLINDDRGFYISFISFSRIDIQNFRIR